MKEWMHGLANHATTNNCRTNNSATMRLLSSSSILIGGMEQNHFSSQDESNMAQLRAMALGFEPRKKPQIQHPVTSGSAKPKSR
jgi:hypothetical protein